MSFLCFIVLSGEGELSYEEQTYQLGEGDCVFIACRKASSHLTSDKHAQAKLVSCLHLPLKAILCK